MRLRVKIFFGAIALSYGTVIGVALPASSAEYTAKIGHLESALQPRHQALLRVSKLVKERTAGKVEFKLFPSAQLGGPRQMNEGVQLGSIEGTVSPAAFLGGFNPVVSILDITFLYPADRKQAQQIRAGKLGKAILASFEKRGFKAITIWANGRKNFTSNKPLGSIAAFKKQRFRVMDSKILIEQFNALGASAIVLAFSELYTSLQTGVVEGQENPLDTIQRMKFYEVQKYLVLSEHGAMEDVVLFSPRWWKKLPKKYQDVIVAAFLEVAPQMETEKEAAQMKALAVIRKAGVKIRSVSAVERAKMRALTYPKTRSAYINFAGADGKKLIAIYEAEYKRITGK